MLHVRTSLFRMQTISRCSPPPRPPVSAVANAGAGGGGWGRPSTSWRTGRAAWATAVQRNTAKSTTTVVLLGVVMAWQQWAWQQWAWQWVFWAWQWVFWAWQWVAAVGAGL